jgi:hypothetical protein
MVKRPVLTSFVVVVVIANLLVPLYLIKRIFLQTFRPIRTSTMKVIAAVLVFKGLLAIFFNYGGVGISASVPAGLKPFAFLVGRINYDILIVALILNLRKRLTLIVLSLFVIIIAFSIKSFYPLFILVTSSIAILKPKTLFVLFLVSLILAGNILEIINYSYALRSEGRANSMSYQVEVESIDQEALLRKITGRITGTSNLLILWTEYEAIRKSQYFNDYNSYSFIAAFVKPILDPLWPWYKENVFEPSRYFTSYVDRSNSPSYGVILGGITSSVLLFSMGSLVSVPIQLLFLIMIFGLVLSLERMFFSRRMLPFLFIPLLGAVISGSPSELFNVVQSIFLLGLLLKTMQYVFFSNRIIS